MLLRHFYYLHLLLLCRAAMAGGIDGILDESHWNTATNIEQFYVVVPQTNNISPIPMSVRLLLQDNGMHIGFRIMQSPDSLITGTAEQDAPHTADFVEVIIDFDGKGKRAYAFSVAHTGQWRDESLDLNGERNADWDGVWEFAVSTDPESWTVEMYIPWSTTAFSLSGDNIHTPGIHLSRYNQQTKQLYGFPKIPPSRSSFLTELYKLERTVVHEGYLNGSVFATAQFDNAPNSRDSRVGASLFWMPDVNSQISATIKPDFGQIESNELVVNLSAVETFFSEKRPFFIESSEFFQTDGPETLLIVHTPRIGGEKEQEEITPNSVSSAISGWHRGELFSVGTFAAFEESDAVTQGRDYYATRVEFASDSTLVGLTNTYVEDQSLDRTAMVSALDFNMDIDDSSLRGQLVYSDIHHGSEALEDMAWWLTADIEQSDTVEHEITVLNYGKDLDVSDFGFVKRVDRKQIEYEVNVEMPTLPWQYIREMSLAFDVEWKTNSANERLPTDLGVDLEFVLPDAAILELSGEFETSGVDDLLTRGNNNFTLPERYAFGALYTSKPANVFNFSAEVETGKSGFDDSYFLAAFSPGVQLTPTMNIDLTLEYLSLNSWLFWDEGNQITDYNATEFSVSLNFVSRLDEFQELRLKLDGVALKASNGVEYNVESNNVLSTPRMADDFSIGEFALQLRYRYRSDNQNEFFVAYTRGGELERDDTALSNGRLISEANTHFDSELFLVKYRYLF